MNMYSDHPEHADGDDAVRIGGLLRQSRESRGESLEDIAEAMRLDMAYLEALEDGRPEDLHGWARAIRYLRAYAEHLGLDASPLVVRLRKTMNGNEEPHQSFSSEAKRESTHSQALAQRKHRMPRGLVFAATALIGIAVLAGWYLSYSSGPERDISPVSQKLKAMLDRTMGRNGEARSPDATTKPDGATGMSSTETDTLHTETKPLPGVEQSGGSIVEKDIKDKIEKGKQVTTIAKTPSAKTPEIQGNSVNVVPVDRFTSSRAETPVQRVTLKANAPVWVRIENDEGKPVLSREMEAGEMYLIPDEDGLVLEVRDAGALDYYLDGKLIGKLGKPGEAISGLKLGKGFFKQAGG